MSVNKASNSNIYKIISDAAGLVGIGTTSPAQLLHVAGRTLIGGATTNSIWDINADSMGINRNISNGAIYDATGHAYQWQHTKSTTAASNTLSLQVYTPAGVGVVGGMTITGAGNVGIGITNPGARLDVDGNIIIRGSSGGNSWANQRLLFAGDGTGYKLSIGSINNYQTINTAVVTIQDNGAVGIGTSSPGTTLEVNGNQFVNGLLSVSHPSTNRDIGYNGSFISTKPVISGQHINLVREGTRVFSIGYVYNTSDFAIGEATATDSSFTSPKFVIQNTTGYVGIGTIAPAGALHVIGDSYLGASSSTVLLLRNVSGENRIDSYNYPVTANYPLLILGSYIRFATTDTERIRITNSGTGIGTSTPEHLFDVRGNSQVKAGASNHTYFVLDTTTSAYNTNILFRILGVDKWSLQGSSNGNIYFLDANNNDGVILTQNATAWASNSDSRLKDVKETISNALEKVNQLTGVKFVWKRDADNPDAKTRVGLIAQDVLAVLPEAVDNGTPDLVTDEVTGKVSGGLNVRYTELVPLLVNAIKELTTRIATLEQRA